MPDPAEPHDADLARAAALFGAGQLDAAAALYRDIAAAAPYSVLAHANLGAVLHAQGRYEPAIAALTKALLLSPTSPAAQRSLAICIADWGFARQRDGRLDDAVALYRKAVALDPAMMAAHNNLGTALLALGDNDGAVAAFRAVLALDPARADAHFNLGNALREQQHLDDAVACYRDALARDPDHVGAALNLATALLDQGLVADAIATYRAAITKAPDWIDGRSNLAMALAYDPAQSPAALRDQARAVGERMMRAAAAAPTPMRDRDPERRLRLGYVSADFRFHPVGWFIQAPLRHRDRTRFEVFCYADHARDDMLTTTLRAEVDHWRVTRGLSDDAFAAQVAQDGIDILIELAGHSAHNRLAALARRPAPLQASWIGFPMTTGLAAIDCLIADTSLAPSTTDGDFTETVVRLPEVGWCYTPPAFAPAVAPLPARAGGGVTFGSFNNPAKLNDAVLGLWAKILARVPSARLLLKFRHLGGGIAAARVRNAAHAAGIAPDRLILEDASPHPAALAAYGRVDIALDPFPFNGGTTTCEALWMGVPVVTFPGATMAGRMGASFVAAAGFPELVGHDPDDMVERAVALAADLDRLAALRANLRAGMAASTLCDGARFTAAFEAALRDQWRRRCDATGA